MLDDLDAHPERYIAGALPSLPLAGDSADLVLCSHLLFTYADRMDLDDHVEAIVEMARVAPEVRIYPLVDHAGTPLPELVRSVIAKLKKGRLTSRIEPVIRPFQPGSWWNGAVTGGDRGQSGAAGVRRRTCWPVNGEVSRLVSSGCGPPTSSAWPGWNTVPDPNAYATRSHICP